MNKALKMRVMKVIKKKIFFSEYFVSFAMSFTRCDRRHTLAQA